MERCHKDNLPLERALRLCSFPDLFEHISDAVVITDLHGTIIYWNKANERITQWIDEEALGRNLFELLSTGQDDMGSKEIVDMLEKEGSWQGETKVRRKDGKTIVVRTTNSVMRDPEGRPLGFIGISIDITQEVKDAELAHEREERYAQMFNAMAQGVLFRDQEGAIIFMNPAAERILGYSAGELIGKTLDSHGIRCIKEDGTPSSLTEHPAFKAVQTGKEVKDVTIGLIDPRDHRQLWLTIDAIPLIRPGERRPYLVYTIFTDVTEQRAEKERSQKAIRETEERLRGSLAEIEAIYDTAPIGPCFLDTSLRFVRINRKMAETNGLPVEEHIGKTPREVIPSLGDQAEAAMNKVLETGQPLLGLEFLGQTASMPGVERTWVESWIPVFDDKGDIIGINVAAEEVTESKRVQKELEDTKARLEAVLNQMPLGMFILEAPSGRVSFANAEVNRMFRYPFDHDLIENIDMYPRWEAHWPDGRPLGAEEYPATRSLRRGETIRNELFNGRRGDGSSIWFQNSSAPVRNENGTIIAAVSMLIDVTEQVEAQNKVIELMESSEIERIRLQTVLDTLPVGIYLVDADGKMLMANSRTEEIWKGVPKRLPNKIGDYDRFAIWSLETGAELNRNDQPIGRILLLGETITGEQYGMRRLDGSVGRIMISGAPIKNAEGRIIGGVIVIQDVTDQRRIEVELARRADALARSNAELQQFAYIASHDLREPLRMISSYLGLLERKYKDKVLDEKAYGYIQFAMNGSIRMQQMINDLLTYSRIDTAGKVYEPTDMNAVVKGVEHNLAMGIAESGASLVHTKLPTIMADPTQMSQLMQNLIDNAIKYRGSEPPRIEISATNKGGKWLFSVRDNGVGVPPSMVERIFQMFQRGYTQEERPGTGIGLAIAKKIVERHGGRIWVESEEGKGATFWFLLPEKQNGDQ